MNRHRTLATAIALLLATAATRESRAAVPGDARWGLVQTQAGTPAPMKAIYFFTGNADPYGTAADDYGGKFGLSRWSKLPQDQRYLRWDDESAAFRAGTVAEMFAANANTIVMSYWGDEHAKAGPMKPTSSSYQLLLTAVEQEASAQRPMQILPAIEGFRGSDNAEHPAVDLPVDSSTLSSNWLHKRVVDIVDNVIPPARRHMWAQMYDRIGNRRYAINLLHLGIQRNGMNDAYAANAIASSLDAIASSIQSSRGIAIGFTLDPFNAGPPAEYYTPTVDEADILTSSNSVLGIQAFNPEIVVGGMNCQNRTTFPPPSSNDPYCPGSELNSCPSGLFGVLMCTDQNTSQWGTRLIPWRQQWTADWVNSGVPVILDVSPGYDYHLPYTPFAPDYNGIGVYGDHAGDPLFIHDGWRNHLSQMKRVYHSTNSVGVDEVRTVKGMVYNAWNGFAEALTAVPSYFISRAKVPPCDYNYAVDECDGSPAFATQLNWLTQQYSVDPRSCDHQHFSSGIATFRTLGAICDRWQELGAEDSFGAPTSDEVDTPQTSLDRASGFPALGRTNDFVNGGSIYWSLGTGSHELYGAINARYKQVGADRSALGLPTSNTLPSPYCADGQSNTFQAGRIDWCPAWGSSAYESYSVYDSSTLLFSPGFYPNYNASIRSGRLTTDATYQPFTPTSAPALPTSRSHVVAAKNGRVLFYSKASGDANTGTLATNGSYTPLGASATSPLGPITNIGAGWTHITAVNTGFHFLYNANTGAGRVISISSTGTISTTHNIPSGFAPWGFVTGLANGSLFFYKTTATALQGYRARVTPSGVYQSIGQSDVFGGGWTDVVGVNTNILFFYNQTNGSAMSAGADASGFFMQRQTWPAGVFPTQGYAAGSRNGSLFVFVPASSSAKTYMLHADDAEAHPVATYSNLSGSLLTAN